MPLKNLLMYRLFITNGVGLATVVLLWFLGYVQQAIQGDQTHLIYLITAVFLFGVVSTFHRASKVSKLMDSFKSGLPVSKVNSTKFLVKSSHLDDIPEILAGLGLLGTLMGFVLGFAGVTDLDKDSAVILAGFSTAIWTTITSTFLFIWTLINKRILFTTSVSLLEDVNNERR
jgi:hypothetical protein